MVDRNNDMSDIENPPPSGPARDDASDAAMAPDPIQHGFWLLKGRLVTAYFTGKYPQPDDEEVAMVDADQRSRHIFVHFWSVVGLFLTFGFMLLFILPSPSTVGSAGFVATRVIAIVGMVVVFCCAGYFIQLDETMDLGNTGRVIENLM